MTNDVTTVKCPTCKKTVIWNEKSIYRPFCSKRCQLIDLGNGPTRKSESPAMILFPTVKTGANRGTKE